MLKVLVIDADSDFASLIGRALLKAGHETRIVGDAKYGIVRAKAFEADLVLVSATVPGVTTSQLVSELKLHVPGRIVVCGDSQNPEEIQAAIVAGANDYVVKSSGVEAILGRAVPSDSKVSSEGENTESDDDEDDASEQKPDEAVSTNKSMVSLRAPLPDGKRPFVVVIAHGDETKRAFVKEIVERINTSVHVIEVSTSEQAITACADNRTVMIIIDWQISNIPTKQAMKTIRESKTGKATAIFVTYKSHSPEKQRLAEFRGAIAFAGEPWDDGSLEGQIKHTFDVIRQRRRKAKMLAFKAQEAKSAS
ncbi:MAG: response regulator [Chloroflexi bacterium]|nr:response regulator [Chloroflexota bacterium]